MITQGMPGRKYVQWIVLASLFLAGPLRAGVPIPVGILRCEGHVYLDDELALSASTVYTGDRVRTDDGRAAISLSRDGAVILEPHSNAVLQNTPQALVIELTQGQLDFTASPGNAFRVDTVGIVMTPSGKIPSLAEIGLRNDGSLVVSVRRGALSIAKLRPDPLVLTGGHVLTVNAQTDQSQGGKVGTGAHGKLTLGERLRTFRIDGLSHNASVAVVLGAAGAGAGIGIAVATSGGGPTVSPSAP